MNIRTTALLLGRILRAFLQYATYSLAVVSAVASAVVAAAAPAVTPATATLSTTQSNSKADVIMVYGDSLSSAYGINSNQGWVVLLEERVKGRGVKVANASISGETTSGGLSRIKVDLARHKPTIVLLALGGNDGLRGLPVAAVQRNLDAMLNAISAAGARAVIVGIQIPPNYGIEYARAFQAVYPTLARARNVALVPFLLDGLAENLDNFQPDRIHPTAAVQPRILQNVLPVVEKMLSAKNATAIGRAPG